MPKATKRERQRQNRDARREAMLEEAKRRRRYKTARNVVIVLVVLALIFAVVQLTKGDDDSTTDATKITCNKTEPVNPPKNTQFPDGPDDVLTDGRTYEVRLHTSCGDIPIKLDQTQAPESVNSFVFLVQNEFYNGTTFHRIVTDFMDQGGDPTGTGSGGPGYTLPDEPPKSGKYKVGDVAMANAGTGTTGSQFFLLVGKEQAASLPPNYSILGHMTDEGLRVAKKINTFGSPDQAGTPTRTIYVFDAGIVFGGKATTTTTAAGASTTTTTQAP